jgi:hypothetical protein
VVFNIVLVAFAFFKSNRSIKKGNLIIVVMVTISFLVSFLPLIAALVFGEWEPMAWSFSLLSLWTNPIIYISVNKNLRRYTTKSIPRNLTRRSTQDSAIAQNPPRSPLDNMDVTRKECVSPVELATMS